VEQNYNPTAPRETRGIINIQFAGRTRENNPCICCQQIISFLPHLLPSATISQRLRDRAYEYRREVSRRTFVSSNRPINSRSVVTEPGPLFAPSPPAEIINAKERDPPSSSSRYQRNAKERALTYGGSIQFLPREFQLLPRLVKRFITPRKPVTRPLRQRQLPRPRLLDSSKTSGKILAEVPV